MPRTIENSGRSKILLIRHISYIFFTFLSCDGDCFFICDKKDDDPLKMKA